MGKSGISMKVLFSFVPFKPLSSVSNLEGLYEFARYPSKSVYLASHFVFAATNRHVHPSGVLN